MQSKAKTIKAYIAEVPVAQRATVKELDAIVRRKVPSAVADMKYGMPTYSVGDRMIAFNAQKQYFSFYADPVIVARFETELSDYSVGKSCIRFRTLDSHLKTILEEILESYGA